MYAIVQLVNGKFLNYGQAWAGDEIGRMANMMPHTRISKIFVWQYHKDGWVPFYVIDRSGKMQFASSL